LSLGSSDLWWNFLATGTNYVGAIARPQANSVGLAITDLCPTCFQIVSKRIKRA